MQGGGGDDHSCRVKMQIVSDKPKSHDSTSCLLCASQRNLPLASDIICSFQHDDANVNFTVAVTNQLELRTRRHANRKAVERESRAV